MVLVTNICGLKRLLASRLANYNKGTIMKLKNSTLMCYHCFW